MCRSGYLVTVLLLLMNTGVSDKFIQIDLKTYAISISITKPKMETKEQCSLVRLLPDGSLVVKLRDKEQSAKIYGIEICQPITSLYIDMMTRRLPRLAKPMQCVVHGDNSNGQSYLQLFYYAGQDKSGDVWVDLALSLLDEGVAQVADRVFPEREEYLRREQKKKSHCVPRRTT